MPDRGLGCVVRSVVETGQFRPFLLHLSALKHHVALGVLTITMLVVWLPPELVQGSLTLGVLADGQRQENLKWKEIRKHEALTRNVDNGTTHAPNKDHTSLCLSLHLGLVSIFSKI